MEKVKELLADPEKLEITIKDSWTKIDTKNEGEVPFDTFKTCCEQIAKEMGIIEMLPTTDKGKEEFKQISDPNNTGKVNFEGFKKIVQSGIDNMKKKENVPNEPQKTNVYIASKNLSDYMKKVLESANITPSTTAPSDESTPNIFIVSGAELSKLSDKDILLAVRTCLEGQTFIIDKPTISDLIGFMQPLNKVLSKEENTYYNDMTDISNYSIKNIFNQFPEADYDKEDKSKKFFESIAMRKSQIYFAHDINEVLEYKEVLEESIEKTDAEITKEKKVNNTNIDDKSSSKEVNPSFDYAKLTQESAVSFGKWINSTEKVSLQSDIDDAKKAQTFVHSFTAKFAVAVEYNCPYNGRTELVQVYIDVWSACDIDNKKDYYMVRTSAICNNNQLGYRNDFRDNGNAGPYLYSCEIISQLAPDHASLKPNDCSPQSGTGSTNFQSGLSFNIEGNVGTISTGPNEGLTNGITISNIRKQYIPDIFIVFSCDNITASWKYLSSNVNPVSRNDKYYYDGPKFIQRERAIFDAYVIYTMDSHDYWSQKEIPLKSMVKIQINTISAFIDNKYNQHPETCYSKFLGCITSDYFIVYIKKPCNSYCNYIMNAEFPPDSTSEDKELYNKTLKELFPAWGRNVKYYGYCDTSKYSPSSTNGRLDNLSKRYFSKIKDTITKKKEELKSKGFRGKFKFILYNSETDKDVDSFELTF